MNQNGQNGSVQKCRGVSVVKLGQHIHDLSHIEEGLTEGSSLILDFAQVESINSADMGSMISLNKRLKARGGRLILINMSAQVLEIFEICKLENVLSICR